MNKKVILVILDGWGITKYPEYSAIAKAKTPFIDNLFVKYPNAVLKTHGEYVGLPDRQMGNSEVGHINIGSGRIVDQDLVKIDKSILKNTLCDKLEIKNIIKYCNKRNKPLHLIGLVSDGGVHSHLNHLYGLIDIFKKNKLEKVFIHAFTDGRDVDPKSGYKFIKKLEEKLKESKIRIATITGRYYGMDRDKRWDRTKLAYDALVHGIGKKSDNLITSIHDSYKQNITDEFLKPIISTDDRNKPVGKIKDGDAVLFFNFRTDRGRQLTEALTQKDFPKNKMTTLKLNYFTMTKYDENFKNVEVVFKKENLTHTLGEVLEINKKTQLRIAETEKYAHVTFFFSGGREKPFNGERRILINSPKVATYDLKPQMSAIEICEALKPEIKSKSNDFICLNFANGDMVGHTGVMKAAIEACEVVDRCVKDIVNCAIKNNYSILLISDHGNCESMINPDGTPHTAHTTNPVPVILIDKNISVIKNGILGNIAPTILKLMGIEQPALMTQKPLI